MWNSSNLESGARLANPLAATVTVPEAGLGIGSSRKNVRGNLHRKTTFPAVFSLRDSHRIHIGFHRGKASGNKVRRVSHCHWNFLSSSSSLQLEMQTRKYTCMVVGWVSVLEIRHSDPLWARISYVKIRKRKNCDWRKNFRFPINIICERVRLPNIMTKLGVYPLICLWTVFWKF